MIIPAWQPTTLYAVGDQCLNAGAQYRCITAGTSASSSGPTGTAADITDGTVHWTWVAVAYGLMPQGFVSKPLDAIVADLGTAVKGNILGGSAGTESDGSIPVQSLAGQIIALIADPVAAAWDLLQALWASFDPGQATDAAQDALCSITGTVRDPASYSTVTGTCVGTAGTVIPGASVATVTGTLARFTTAASATIAAAAAYAGGATQVLGDRVTVGGAVYQCTTGGVNGSALTGAERGITTPGATWGTGIADGATVVWRYLGTGTGVVDTAFQSEVVGALAATAGTLFTIATPVYGWNQVYNIADATAGALLETSTHLRVKREAELHAVGLAAADAIRAVVLQVGAGTAAPVTSCSVFVNDTDATVNSMPPHSVMALADYAGVDNPTLDQAIADAIWSAVGAGIATTFGTATGAGYAFTSTVTDDSGTAQTVKWARPVLVPIYIVANVIYDSTPGVFPATEGTGPAATAPGIKGSLVTLGAAYVVGRDVYASALAGAIFEGPQSSVAGATAVPGILDVTSLYIGVAPAPGTSVPITITALQRATFSTGNMVVNLTGATP